VADIGDETVVVEVRMRDEHPQQGVVGFLKAGQRGKLGRVAKAGAERAAEVEQDAAAVGRLDLHTAAADLLRSAMNPHPHVGPLTPNSPR
jgi:hypothetical protein